MTVQGEQAAALLAAPGAAPDRVPLARALLGHGEDRLACDLGTDGVDAEQEGPEGLIPRADDARAQVLAAFGDLPLGGFAPGGLRSGCVRRSAHHVHLVVLRG